MLQQNINENNRHTSSPHVHIHAIVVHSQSCASLSYYVAHLPSKDGPFCSLVLDRLNGVLLTGGAGRHKIQLHLGPETLSFLKLLIFYRLRRKTINN